MTTGKKQAGVLFECIKLINNLPNPAMNIEDEKRIVIELTGCVEKLELVIEADIGDEQRQQLEGMIGRWRQRIAIAKERIENA